MIASTGRAFACFPIRLPAAAFDAEQIRDQERVRVSELVLASAVRQLELLRAEARFPLRNWPRRIFAQIERLNPR
jgi:hypothetical protein